MSKAFTRESDDFQDDDEPLLVRRDLPAGAKNYMTPDGAQRLRGELARLNEQRHALRQNSENIEANRIELRALERQIHLLTESLAAATVVENDGRDPDCVRFGATVTVRDATGAETSYRIVGIDEADIDKGYVSWLSPLAKALLNARVGRNIRFQTPSGEDDLEIVRIEYH